MNRSIDRMLQELEEAAAAHASAQADAQMARQIENDAEDRVNALQVEIDRRLEEIKSKAARGTHWDTKPRIV